MMGNLLKAKSVILIFKQKLLCAGKCKAIFFVVENMHHLHKNIRAVKSENPVMASEMQCYMMLGF